MATHRSVSGPQPHPEADSTDLTLQARLLLGGHETVDVSALRGDGGDRAARRAGACQLPARRLQPAATDPAADRVALAPEQLVQVAQGDAVPVGDRPGRQVGIPEGVLDGGGDALEEQLDGGPLARDRS
ncbi:hypothetical protein [Kitasatospora brasiliensis]|uniref:hypothetical protein n=1 Tax=Kitasatospora brasiliensis TaxID=3058040 RepID=UPI0032C247C6